jgi:hypothetical protein
LASGLGIKRAQVEDTEREQLVSITLEVIDAESISVDALVKLRTDKTALGAELRQNYATAVEGYVNKLSEPSLTDTDARTLRKEFRQKMTQDMNKLYEELAPVAKKTLLSKEVAVAIAAPVVGVRYSHFDWHRITARGGSGHRCSRKTSARNTV